MFKKLFSKNSSNTKEVIVHSPVDGEIVLLDDVSDPVFSGRMIGDGVAINPANGDFYAPINGKLATLFPTLHAYGIETADGTQVLLHIGMDTVELKGKGFKTSFKQGDDVLTTNKLVEVNLQTLTKNKKPIITPVVITNETVKNRKITIIASGTVKKGDPIFKIG